MRFWQNLEQSLTILASDPKTAAATSAYTVSIGIGAFIANLQGLLSIFATIVGIILSSILSFNHYKKGKIERSLAELEKDMARQKIKAIEQEIEIQKQKLASNQSRV